jgi:hypothetical protein
MIPKYTVEYKTQFKRHSQPSHFTTDDPVACTEFLEEILETGLKIEGVKHDGLDLPKHEFDKMIKTAAGMLAARLICASLGLKPEEEKYRFGFAA